MADAERSAIISKIYYNVKTGFQSIAKTHAEAEKVDPSITRAQVKKWMDGIEYRQLKARKLTTHGLQAVLERPSKSMMLTLVMKKTDRTDML